MNGESVKPGMVLLSPKGSRWTVIIRTTTTWGGHWITIVESAGGRTRHLSDRQIESWRHAEDVIR